MRMNGRAAERLEFSPTPSEDVRMRFTVCHETIYRYSAPVSLSPHLLRLNPRAEGAAILERSLTVDPKPIAFREETDRFGNRVTHLDFEGFSDRLRIESRFDLETVAPEPFAGLGAPPLPWSGGPDDPMAQYRSGEAQEPAVREFASALASESRWQVLLFLDRLNRALFARMRHEIRAEGAAWSPERTLVAGGGACRDVTALFMAACRSLGIAARFVSGYQAEADTPDGRRHLHAWPEAFLPGVGWRGFDPTHGLAVTDGHVALCAAPDQAATMPIEGGFYGDGVASTLEYDVQIATG